jgi:hypothetical protein
LRAIPSAAWAGIRSGAGAANPHRAALIKTQELVFERFFNDRRVFRCY